MMNSVEGLASVLIESNAGSNLSTGLSTKTNLGEVEPEGVDKTCVSLKEGLLVVCKAEGGDGIIGWESNRRFGILALEKKKKNLGAAVLSESKLDPVIGVLSRR